MISGQAIVGPRAMRLDGLGKKRILRPVQKPNALKRWTYGVAIWTGPDPADPKAKPGADERKPPTIGNSNYFSVFISGLSNGLAETDHPKTGCGKLSRLTNTSNKPDFAELV